MYACHLPAQVVEELGLYYQLRCHARPVWTPCKGLGSQRIGSGGGHGEVHGRSEVQATHCNRGGIERVSAKLRVCSGKWRWTTSSRDHSSQLQKREHTFTTSSRCGVQQRSSSSDKAIVRGIIVIRRPTTTTHPPGTMGKQLRLRDPW
eukprot:PhF_6_TR5652/c0_g1_i2/m.8266